jgi:glucose 1-dehydrogenase
VRAATVVPGRPDLVRLDELPDPVPAAGELLVEGLLVGLCHTDFEIINGRINSLPAGRDRMVLFHESLGRVLSAPAGSDFAVGDLVSGLVRRPCPQPCGPCGAGRSDFCVRGDYTERGVTGLDGFGSQLWTVPAEFAVRHDPVTGDAGVLAEPASVVAKAWDQVDIVGGRVFASQRSVLVTGAGPVGLLAALLGVRRGLEVHVLDRVTDGIKPDLVRQLGAKYHSDLDSVPAVDVVIECTGVGPLMFDAVRRITRNAVVVLVGLSTSDDLTPLSPGLFNDKLVFANNAVVGTVNAGPVHYERAADALRLADQDWLARLITRRVPLSRWTDALVHSPDDIKVVVELPH